MILLQTYDLVGIEPGTAILFVGLMAILLWASVTFRNPMAVVMWGITVLLFALSGLFGFGIEVVWIGVTLTTLLIVVGVSLRMSN